MASSTANKQTSKKNNRISQVTFTGILDKLALNEDIKVTYTLCGNWIPTPSDWVGLFHANAQNPNEYITYEYAKTPSRLDDQPVTLNVTFKAYYLPKGGAQAFRFYYVTKKGNIRGKSSPFVFAKLDEGTNADSDTSSDIVVVDNCFGDTDKILEELDGMKRENFSLRKRLEEAEDQAKNLTDHLSSAEAQIELLCNAVSKQDEQTERKADLEVKMEQELIRTSQKLLESEGARSCLLQQIKVLQDNGAAMEEEMSMRLHKAESERDCLQVELAHLQEATATSRFREAELRKAIDTAQDTTRALILENNEKRVHEEALLLAEEQIQKLTKDLNLSEQIRQELETRHMQYDETANRSRSSSNADQYMDSSVEERVDGRRIFRSRTDRSQEMEQDNDTDASTSSIDIKPSSSISNKEQRRFFPNAFDRLVKAVLK